MWSSRTTRNALVFFAAKRSLIASSCVADIPLLSGVAIGQSSPGQDAAFASTPNESRIHPAANAHRKKRNSIGMHVRKGQLLTPVKLSQSPYPDRLDIDEFANAERGQFASIPRVFNAAERQTGIRADEVIDEAASCIQFLRGDA